MSRSCFVVTLALSGTLGAASPFAQTGHDDFHHLGEINKASIVMLADVGLVPEPLAATIADGITQVMAEQAEPGARRSGDYLVFEARLVEVAGRDASRLHTGHASRSPSRAAMRAGAYA